MYNQATALLMSFTGPLIFCPRYRSLAQCVIVSYSIKSGYDTACAEACAELYQVCTSKLRPVSCTIRNVHSAYFLPTPLRAHKLPLEDLKGADRREG